MTSYDRGFLKETKALSNKVLNEDLDGVMRIQEWLFRTYMGPRTIINGSTHCRPNWWRREKIETGLTFNVLFYWEWSCHPSGWQDHSVY
jgi:hypothetical protein